MTDSTKATARPWLVHRYVTGNGIAKHVGTVGGGLVASVGDHDARCGGLHRQYASAYYDGLDRMEVMDANAALIVEAVNAHARLQREHDAVGELLQVWSALNPPIEVDKRGTYEFVYGGPNADAFYAAIAAVKEARGE